MRRAWTFLTAPGGLSRSRFVLVVVVSMLATGVVVGAGLSGGDASSVDLALAAQRNVAVQGTPAGTAASSTPTSTGAAASSTGTTATASTASDSTGSADASAAAVDSGVVDTSGTGSTDTGTATTPTTTDGSSTPASPASDIKHVFVVVLGDGNYDATFGAGAAAAPYLNGDLKPKGVLLTNYTTVDPADLPNGIALLGGQPPNAQTKANCPTFTEVANGDGCVYPVDTITVADQLGGVQKTWKAYVDGLDKPCSHPPFGQPDPSPLTRRNPFVYFHSLLDLGACATNDVALDALPADLRSAKKTPDFAYVAEGPCPDGQTEPGCSDAFAQKWVPQILKSAAYRKDGLLVVAFAGGGKTGALVVSPFATAGATSDTAYGPYSVLRTIEDTFGITQHLGKADGGDVAAFGADVLKGAGAGD